MKLRNHSLKHLWPRLARRQRVEEEARRHSRVRPRYMHQPLIHRQRAVFRLQVRQHRRAACQHRHRLSPAFRRVGRAELRSNPKRNPIVRLRRVQPQHGLRDDKPNVVLKRVLQSLRPARRRVCLRRRRVNPHLAVVIHRHRERAHIVRERVEGAAARQVEAGVVPVACQDAVLHRAPDPAESPCAGSGCPRRTHVSPMREHRNRVSASRHHRATASPRSSSSVPARIWASVTVAIAPSFLLLAYVNFIVYD